MIRLLLAAAGGGSFAIPPLTYDDEFDNATTLSGPWGANAGDPTTQHLDIGVTTPGCLYLQGQLYRVAPAIPFTVTSKADVLDWDHSGGAVQIGGVWINIAEAAPGPYMGAGPDCGSAGSMQLTGSTFDAAGAFTGNVHSGSLHSVMDDSYAVAHRTRMTVNSASDVDWDVSFDNGATWINILTGYDPGFTINYVGLESGGCRTSFDWFRVTQP